MALLLLTEDEILADYLRSECPALVWAQATEPRAGDAVIVDADTCPPPFPPHTVLLIAREDVPAEIPCLLRPLAPGALARALAADESPKLDPKTRTVTAGGTAIALAPAEFALAALLIGREGEIVTRGELCACLEGEGDADALLTVYTYRLRRRLAPLGLTLRTHHKKGYSLTREGKVPC